MVLSVCLFVSFRVLGTTMGVSRWLNFPSSAMWCGDDAIRISMDCDFKNRVAMLLNAIFIILFGVSSN